MTTPRDEIDYVQRAIDVINALTARIRADREFPASISQTLLALVVAGDGLLPDKGQEEVEGHKAQAGQEQEDSLFVSEQDVDPADAAYIPDEMDEDSDGDVEDATEDKNIEFLNNVADCIENLHAPLESGFPTPSTGLAMESRDHQYKALGIIERAMQDKYKALLIGGPPGLGKTLISLMAAVKMAKKARRFSIIVAPSRCVDQWYSECTKFFVQDTVSAMVTRDATILPTNFTQQDLIITLYGFVMSRFRKMREYQNTIRQNKRPR